MKHYNAALDPDITKEIALDSIEKIKEFISTKKEYYESKEIQFNNTIGNYEDKKQLDNYMYYLSNIQQSLAEYSNNNYNLLSFSHFLVGADYILNMKIFITRCWMAFHDYQYSQISWGYNESGYLKNARDLWKLAISRSKSVLVGLEIINKKGFMCIGDDLLRLKLVIDDSLKQKKNAAKYLEKAKIKKAIRNKRKEEMRQEFLKKFPPKDK